MLDRKPSSTIFHHTLKSCLSEHTLEKRFRVARSPTATVLRENWPCSLKGVSKVCNHHFSESGSIRVESARERCKRGLNAIQSIEFGGVCFAGGHRSKLTIRDFEVSPVN
mmetsp:Transcript_37281/g.99281  ORF Transcript_37281/g.99281 Transcript_37281/m.99281 type:complete len:110 (+) Transcript_37281:1272-1601(+)